MAPSPKLVLHGSWMPDQGSRPSRFVLWAETVDGRSRVRRHAVPDRPRPHPFGATGEGLQSTLEGLVALGSEVRLLARLPSGPAGPLPSPELIGEAPEGELQPEVRPWKLEALALDPGSTSTALLALAAARPPAVSLGADVRLWIAATRFALSLLCRERLLPWLEEGQEPFEARWRPLLDEEQDTKTFRRLVEALPGVCLALQWAPGRGRPRVERAPPRSAEDLLRAYLGAVVDALARDACLTGAPPPRLKPSPVSSWATTLTLPDAIVPGRAAELRAFATAFRAWVRAAETQDGAFRLCFRLEPPDAGERAPSWSLRYLLQARDDPSLLVSAEKVWRQRGATAELLQRRFENPQERLLVSLSRAGRLFPPIEASLAHPAPVAASLSTEEANAFLREKALLLRSSGFGVLVPGLEAPLRLRLRLGRRSADPAAGSSRPTFGWDSLVDFDWQVAIGDQTLSREEFLALARLKQPLVQVRGRWVELQPDQVEQALAALREASGEMALPEALRTALGQEAGVGALGVDVSAEGALASLLAQLRDGQDEPRHELAEPPGFVGRLRPYQKRGLAWLDGLRRHGLGACLADDMGLGKTVQLIALLLHRPPTGPGGRPAPALLVCPTSVVGNWRHELARFAPSLRVLVHHGPQRRRRGFVRQARAHDLVITSYGLLARDGERLARVAWGDVILDEAQNVKNSATQAAQAARALTARWRVALTGTPIENRLGDLWSLLHFLNPGYLGSARDFRRRFGLPIERAGDVRAAERLRRLVAPFVLRRVKTDRRVIQDLPRKNEMKVWCTLTSEQATLYQAVVEDALRRVEEAEGMERRGLILAMLTQLKQVCDHPALLLHDRSELDGRSGKLARLVEMLEEAVEVGDRALVFTQYAEMGRLLQPHLEGRLGSEVLFLHGGTPRLQRERMVARFQADGRGPAVFILSLKAGGTGLNLTRATHVFHFDRWWNPAVESQATDRAFRIGQRRDVQVHKLVCAGTFEEVLDGLLERKRGLAERIVGAGEQWITEMSTTELRELFHLRAEAVEEGP